MASAISPLSERKRVKVYELRDGDWYDRGTGFCAANLIQEDSRIFVESEEERDAVLLEYQFRKDDQFQKQQETLIVWTDREGVDMAMSFQEIEGCAMVWNMLNEAQDRLEEICDAPAPVLPSPELGNLAEIETIIERSSCSQAGRDTISKVLISTDYIAGLAPLVETAEDLEDLPDLHRLCRIMKTLILLNENTIIENVIKDEVMMGVVGALEYDPDFPSHKANHRQYLSKVSRFKQVVKIDNEDIEKKIHLTYRLQYLKDVVLARVLDDPTFNVLNSQIYFYHSEIVNYIQSNELFMKELSAIITSSTTGFEQKKDVVFLIQQCCAIAKLASSRSTLYQSMISCGLFTVLAFALQHQESLVRTAGTDILVAVVDNDPFMIRSYIFKTMNDSAKPLTDTLISLLLAENDLGVKAQIADAIKVLLDPSVPATGQDRGLIGDNGFAARFKANPQHVAQTESFIEHFYKNSARKLFQPLLNLDSGDNLSKLSSRDVSVYAHLVEMLCFFLRQHAQRSRYFIISEGLGGKIAKLLTCPEKHLRLASVKYFRTLLSLQDEYYNRQMVQNRVFDPMLDALHSTMPRDNLLNSACLELFEFVRHEGIKAILEHLVESYRERLQSITHVDTFEGIICRYEELMSAGESLHQRSAEPLPDSSFISSDPDSPNTHHISIPGSIPRWQDSKRVDLEEEGYFNEGDGDAETSSSIISGASPLKSLVDYEDDEDEHAQGTLKDPQSEAAKAELVKSQEPKGSKPAAVSITHEPSNGDNRTVLRTPTFLLSEKRRREDEDEDNELGRLSSGVNKRRNSSSSAPRSTKWQDSDLKDPTARLSMLSGSDSNGANDIQISARDSPKVSITTLSIDVPPSRSSTPSSESPTHVSLKEQQERQEKDMLITVKRGHQSKSEDG